MSLKPYHINKKQWFPDVESIYKARMNSFLALASRHVYNKDYAIDAVQDACVKAVEYFKKNPDRKVREQVMRWLILKSVKKINKYSKELPYGLMNESYVEQDDG